MASSKNKTGFVLAFFPLSKWCKGEKESIGFKPKTEVQPNRAHPLLQRSPHHTVLLPRGWAWECQKSEWSCFFWRGFFLFAATQFNLTWAYLVDKRAGSNKDSLMGFHKHWLSNSAKCRTLWVSISLWRFGDITFSFLPAWDLYTLSGLRPLHHQHVYIYVSHTLICCPLGFYPLINHLFQILFKRVSSVVFNKQWTRATENNACYSQRKLTKCLIVGATHHFNSDSPDWVDRCFIFNPKIIV